MHNAHKYTYIVVHLEFLYNFCTATHILIRIWHTSDERNVLKCAKVFFGSRYFVRTINTSDISASSIINKTNALCWFSVETNPVTHSNVIITLRRSNILHWKHKHQNVSLAIFDFCEITFWLHTIFGLASSHSFYQLDTSS